MHNWRFLLLAFVAVFQPIASYTERSLVDGRQQRCNYRTASVLRDPGAHFHGTYHLSKPAVEDRRLNQRADIREISRNEVREESHRRISSPDRRLVENLERGDNRQTRPGSFSRTESRLARDGVVLPRETRDNREERNQEIRGESPLSNYESRRNRIDSRQSNRLYEDEHRSRVTVDNRRSSASRLSMERRDTRENLGNTQTQRNQETRETRIVSDRMRDDITRSNRVDRRIGRERAQTMDMERSKSRLQLNRNANRGILDQRFRNTELRSSSMSSVRVHRTRDINEDSRMATRANTQSLDRDERRSTRLRRSADEQHDINRSRVTINRDRASADQRDIRQALNRNGKATSLQSDQTTEGRRDVSRADTRSLGRDRSVENRRESRYAERDMRRAEAIRFVENRDSQNSRRDSRILGRGRSVEKRRDIRDNSRSVERVAENRRDSRSAEHARISDNRREIRNVARESRTMMMDRTGKNKRDVRTIELNLERSIEVRREALKNNRDSFLLNNERSGSRVADRNNEMVDRILSADRSAENQRNTRNVARDSRISGLEQATDNRRDTRNVERKSRVLERYRIVESLRNTRMNLREVRSIEKERSLASRRDTRNTESRSVTTNDNDRRNTQDVVGQSRIVERAANYRRVTRGNERDVSNIARQQLSEARNSRNTHRDSRVRATSFESRQDARNVERQSRTTGVAQIQSNVRSFREERSTENRRDDQKVNKDFRMVGSERLAENRRERATESRREIRNIGTDARTARNEEARRVESRIINIVRSRDLSMERRNYRKTERLNMRDTQLDNRRSRSAQRESGAESRRTFERNVEIGRRQVESPVRKLDFLGMESFRKTQDENETPTMNWQYIFYTLQGLYICGVLTQLMNERSAVKKTRSLSWWSAPQQLIKVD